MTIARFIRLFRERLDIILVTKTAWSRVRLVKEINIIIEGLLLEALEEK